MITYSTDIQYDMPYVSLLAALSEKFSLLSVLLLSLLLSAGFRSTRTQTPPSMISATVPLTPWRSAAMN